jgi:hypothetical protein
MEHDMSRYTIPAQQPEYTCIVGYDPPFGTFFAQVSVITGVPPQPHLILWVGTEVRAIETVPALTQALRDYAEIPAAIQQQLAADARKSGFRPNFGTHFVQYLKRKKDRS